MKVDGKVALVTGSAQGIGKALSRRLLELGAKWVSIVDIDKRRGQETEEELAKIYGKQRVGYIWCDVALYDKLTDAFEETYKKYSKLDIVVNNAAVTEGTDFQWDKIVEVNYLAVVRGITLAKKYMSKENGGGGGVVINTASVNGLRNSWTPIYGSTKTALISLSRCLPEGDLAFSEGGMRVGAICPGYVDTALGNAGNSTRDPDDVMPIPVPIESVVDGYIKIIADDSMNGVVITATAAGNLPWTFKSNEEVDRELKIFPS